MKRKRCFLFHRYEILTKEVLPSAYEQMSKDCDVHVKGYMASAFHKPVIVRKICLDCGHETLDRV